MGAQFLGIDIGSVTIKAALIGVDCRNMTVPRGFTPPVDTGRFSISFSPYERTKGRPIDVVEMLLDSIRGSAGGQLNGVRMTGGGAHRIADNLGLSHENEFLALSEGVSLLYPSVRTVFEMGGETSKYLRLEPIIEGRPLSITDYDTNGDCAAGTGSFIDQQVKRLGYRVEDIGKIVANATRIPKIAGRCSVFAKSDMIHAQQKGYHPREVLAGLCRALAANFKGAVTRNKEVVTPVLFVGGLAANDAVASSLRVVFDLDEWELLVPKEFAWLSALGAAVRESKASSCSIPTSRTMSQEVFPEMPPLSLERVTYLKDRITTVSIPDGTCQQAFLGIDVGSVSTNFAILNRTGEILWELYVRTKARPIEVTKEGLRKLEHDLGGKIEIVGVGTTGSGRELVGHLIGADTVNDEITAHQKGANFIANKYLNTSVDTIFEIGGQDSKYIRLEDGVVVDFAMNEACAAGTGSFLEERAVELDVSIKDEFAKRAFQSEHPIRLGERCTVFMERDVFAYLRRGAEIDDLVAGLSYSVVLNYINRVVRGRPADGVIFFQGGTAYNDAVSAAFASILERDIVVPPHNGVMGAIGAALLARETIETCKDTTRFRGLHLDAVPVTFREFTCSGCANKCSIQEFNVDGERSYWGDQCSDRYRKPQKTDNEPVGNDLIREFHENLPRLERDGTGPCVGIPLAMYNVEFIRYWHAFFEALDWSIRISPPTNKDIVERGLASIVAEPCFPITVAHGHASLLLDEDIDMLFCPSIINRETCSTCAENFTCVWGQTLPYVLRASPRLEQSASRIFSPVLRLREQRKRVIHELSIRFARFGLKKQAVRDALEWAESVHGRYTETRLAAGSDVLSRLQKAKQPGILLTGRPYNLYDRRINLSLAEKIRDSFGIDVIPMDVLDLNHIDIGDVSPNMFWNYGRRILAAAKVTRDNPYLHLIHVTNFKCGPDSFIKHYIGDAGKKPFLILQFDGHANDAGMMTRCEAFLQSKGMIQRTRRKRKKRSIAPEAA